MMAAGEEVWISRKREYMTRREDKERERERAQQIEREERNIESEEQRIGRKRETWKDRTEEWLCDAAMRGDIESLKEIMKIDYYILDRVLVGSFKGKNPLHIATSTGQKEFVLELLEYKQDLAKAVDTELGTALHIASSKGYLDIVELLVEVSPEMCAARDREGNNSLHIAAIKGNVEVLQLLLRTNPYAARVMVDQGDNILHLCVKYNQLVGLELLLDKVGNEEFVKSTDINGNNILHLAVFFKRYEIIKYLLLERPKEKKGVNKLGQLIDVNARNGSGWTALDIHSRIAKSEDNIREYCDIKDILRESGVKKSNKLFFPFDPYWQKKKKDTLMIVSSLMATMSFQVGINPPGGVWDQSSPEHEAGKARIAYTNSKAYPYLVYFNTIGFLLSLTTILELIVVLPTQKRAFGFIRAGISWLTIMIMAFAYTFSVIIVSPPAMYKPVNLVILTTVIVWAVVISFLRVLPFHAQFLLLSGLLVIPMELIALGPVPFVILLVFLYSKFYGGFVKLYKLLAQRGTKPTESTDQSTGETAPPPNPTAASQNDSTSVSIRE
ncbi:ankyrin repeat-containing protein At5g02620-like [Rhododendron vialii]|uniref:ankyrin repeat-containing protein At5g02620-like n=1 Tax=Rhododendron vialii TaxID=182163 RepID=UPI002660017D|nr:ankyrin repeat-containing protein At5g02620-like [Rhododendron vialii]